MSEEAAATEDIKFKMNNDENPDNIKFDIEDESESGCVRETTEFSFKGQNFFANYWRKKDAEPKNIVFLIHGYGEYINFAWHDLARHLVDECGSLVVSHDHVGHGKSSGTRVHVESMDEYVDPVLAHLGAVTRLHPGTKVFLYGHSMGGLISLFTIFKKQELFSGFVGCGPLVMIDPELATPFLRFVSKMLQGVLPYFSLKKMEHELVTRDAEVVAKRKEDTLLWHGGFRARHSYVLMQACDYAQNNLPNLTLPILVLQGEQDKMCTPLGAKMLVDNCSSKDKELVSYPEAYHNVVCELEDVKKDVLEKIKGFINRLT